MLLYKYFGVLLDNLIKNSIFLSKFAILLKNRELQNHMRQLKISKQFTNRESKSLDKYLNEISKVPMIDAQEEVELARRIREGDQAALEKLVNANLRFVVSVS